MREAWKQGSGKHMFGLSLFRPSRKERFKYPLRWENKINQMPYPRANKDKSLPHALPPHPPPSPRRPYNNRCINRVKDEQNQEGENQQNMNEENVI